MPVWTVVAAGLLVLIGIAAFVGATRRSQKRRRKQEMRISVPELHRRIEQREPIVMLDLRHPLDVLAAPQLIPGAIPVKPDEFESCLGNVGHDSEIVLYCTCPNEETSLDVYCKLVKRGFQRVKVLTGGLPAWKREDLPLQDLYPELEQQLRKRAAAEV